MSDPKIKLTRNQLIKILKENKFDKSATADVLCVTEASVRRACKRLDIDVDLERKANVKEQSLSVKQYKVSKSTNNTKIIESSYVIVPDVHAHEVDWDYMRSVCKFIKDFKPNYLIQLGDLMDYACLMSKRKQKYPNFDGKDIKSLEHEFQACAKILSMLNQSVPKSTVKIFLKGNHEYRADSILAEYPEFDSLINIEKRLDISDWKVLEYLEHYKLGKLNIIHGEFFGVNNVAKHLRHYQKNVVYGHTHAIQQDTMASPMREIPIWGATIGCGCNVNPDYQRNKSNQWQHGFAYGWFDKVTGDFDCQVKRVINAKFWAEGKRYV